MGKMKMTIMNYFLKELLYLLLLDGWLLFVFVEIKANKINTHR